MSKTAITLEFTGLAVTGDVINITNNLAINPYGTMELYRWSSYIIKIGANVAEQATNFILAFNLDWNSTGLYNVIFDGVSKVNIEPVNDGTILSDGGSYANVIITQDAPITPPVSQTFFIDTLTLSEALSNPCDNIRVTVTTTTNMDSISSPVIATGIASTTYLFDYIRGALIRITVNSSGVDKKRTLLLPQAMSDLNMTVSINYSLAGATLLVGMTNINGLTLQYSLDNVIWQLNNTFSGQSDGAGTMYVKDQYGCTISKAYTVLVFGTDVFNSSEPYHYVPKTSSIKMIERVTIDGINIYKTDENQFAYNSLAPLNGINLCGLQLFQSTDLLTIQFKSNYETIAPVIVKEDDTTDALALVKQTSNIGRKDKRDATLYQYSATQIGVYFTSGTTYNYDTSLAESTYALNGNLPEFAIIGEFININGNILKIIQTFFDETVGYNVILADYEYAGAPLAIIVSSIYNLHNYEIYEFDIDFSTYANSLIELQIQMTDTRTGFDDVTYVSENLDIKDLHDYTLEVIYYNVTNSDTYYGTGIQNKIRLEFNSITPILDEDFENSINDNDTVSIFSTIHEINKFEFSEVDNEIAKKIVIAMSHKFVFINRVGYAKFGNASIDPVTNNSSIVSIEMIKTGISYSSTLIDEIISEVYDVPALIEANNNYIKL